MKMIEGEKLTHVYSGISFLGFSRVQALCGDGHHGGQCFRKHISRESYLPESSPVPSSLIFTLFEFLFNLPVIYQRKYLRKLWLYRDRCDQYLCSMFHRSQETYTQRWEQQSSQGELYVPGVDNSEKAAAGLGCFWDLIRS